MFVMLPSLEATYRKNYVVFATESPRPDGSAGAGRDTESLLVPIYSKPVFFMNLCDSVPRWLFSSTVWEILLETVESKLRKIFFQSLLF